MKKGLISLTALIVLGTSSVATASANAITTFKQQSTDDATIATKKSIRKLTQADLNNFIPTQAQKIGKHSVTDPGSDATFVTKVNYHAVKNPQNKINLPKGYTIKGVKYVASKKAEKDHNAQIKFGKIGLEGLALNSFTPSTKDLKTNVDLNHVTKAQSEELTQFTIDLINPVIKKLGGTTYRSSSNVNAAAQMVANVYSQDNWNNTGKKYGHDSRVHSVISKKFNVKDVAEENYSDNPSFGLTSTTLKKRVVSMAALKHAVYNSMALQLFEDGPSYWGHTSALLNLDIKKQYQPNYLGTSFDKFGGIHFFMIPHNQNVNKEFNVGKQFK